MDVTHVVLAAVVLAVILSHMSHTAVATAIHPSLEGALSGGTTACYVINLHKRADRANDFLQYFYRSDLQDLGLQLSVVPGVDGTQLDVRSLVTSRAWAQILDTERTGRRLQHSHLTRGAVGCAMSHLAVLRRFLATDKQYAIIFEDDAALMFKIGAAIQHTLDTSHGAWDVLLLGFWCQQCGATSVRAFWGLHAYMVTRRGAQLILDGCAPPFEMQIDHRMSQLAQRGQLRIMHAAKSLVPQAPSDVFATDIQTPVASTALPI